MTTKIINLEDSMPYVEPVRPHTPKTIFRDSIEFSLEMAEDSETYYRKGKQYARANVQRDVAAVLKEIAESDYPESKMESTLDRLRRVYMELVAAQVDAQDAILREAKKDLAAKEEAKVWATDAQRKNLQEAIKQIEAGTPGLADAVAHETKSQAEFEAEQDEHRKNNTGPFAPKEATVEAPKALTAGTTTSA